MPYNPNTTTHFYRPGVNPQSMDPTVSGDNCMSTVQPYKTGQHMALVIDGAWVKGFDNLGQDIAQWSSETLREVIDIAAEALARMAFKEILTARQILTQAVPLYRKRVEHLRKKVNYNVTAPAPFENIDLAKIGPQSAFAMVMFNPSGSLDIAQGRDCLIALEKEDGTFIATPNQSESVAAAGKILGIQNEDAALFSYQSVAKDIILNGQWKERRRDVAKLAKKAHKPVFWPLWQQFDATMPDTLSGEDGWHAWHQALSLLTLCYNSSSFLNNPEAMWGKEDNGDLNKASWAMFTGEESMLHLTFFQTFTEEEMAGVKAVWIMSDGAFKQGDRGEDLRAMRDLGPEKYYEEVLLPRFDNATPGRKRYADDRVPMDVTILRIPLTTE